MEKFKTSERKKKAGRYCCAYACSNEPVQKKGGLCHKHYRRKRRATDPVGVRYQDFKKNALDRGKEFRITLNEFRAWCNETGYIIQKGRRGQSATVDRIRNSEGYHLGNLQLLTNRANASKGASDLPF